MYKVFVQALSGLYAIYPHGVNQVFTSVLFTFAMLKYTVI